MYKVCLLLFAVSSPLYPMLSRALLSVQRLPTVAIFSEGMRFDASVVRQMRMLSNIDLLREHIENKDYSSFDRMIRSGVNAVDRESMLLEVADLPFDSLRLLLECGTRIPRIERRSYTLLNTFAQDLRYRDQKVCTPSEAARKQVDFSSDEQVDILRKVIFLVFNDATIDMTRDYRAQKPWDQMHPFINPDILPDVVAFLSEFRILLSPTASEEEKDAAADKICLIMQRNCINGEEVRRLTISDVSPSRIQDNE